MLDSRAEPRTTSEETGRTNTAVLYRMVMPGHVCPYGLKSKWLLERHGFGVDDRHLTTRDETDAFQAQHDVSTTPQTFIGGERVGGYEALAAHLTGAAPSQSKYTPVLVIFAVCALMAGGFSQFAFGEIVTLRGLEWFAALSVSVLAIQKLMDVETFSTMFLNYDLLARRWVPYAYLYPFIEGTAGVLMIAGGVFAATGAPLALLAGGIGAVSVFKAVYIDKRELKCACVGGGSSVPLGVLSLTENLVMVAMGIWMLTKPFV